MVIVLKEVRVDHDMTIRELAKKSGVSKSHISEIENGKKIPSILVVCKLAKALGVGIEKLVYYK